jgi:glycosyltransferase involved in cell wall biosynthesis
MNEAHRIRACLDSASFADQVVLVDGGSTDATRDIAAAMGAEVHAHSDWKGFAEQRNRLLAYVRCDYVFFLDADEVIGPELQADLVGVVHGRTQAVWEIQWEEVAFGRRLSRMNATGGIRRLFPRHLLCGFDGVVHEKALLARPDVDIRRFTRRLLHHSRPTVYSSLKKLAQYVQLGAAKRAEAGRTGGVLRGFGSGLAIFIKLYVIRRGFLCGPQGFLFCFFIALECFFRYAALKYDQEADTVTPGYAKR